MLRRSPGPPARGRSSSAGGALLTALLASCGFLLVAPASVGAATSRASSGSTVGTVTSVDVRANTFVVRTPTGSKVAVKVTSATAYRDSLVRAPSFTDVKVGVSVAVIGTAAHGVETAAIVIVGGAGGSSPSSAGGPVFGGPGGSRPGLFGKVTAVDAAKGTFTVQTARGAKVTVKVTKATAYRDRGKAKAGLSDVKVGSDVAVVATKVRGVEQATTVLVGFAFPGSFSPPAST